MDLAIKACSQPTVESNDGHKDVNATLLYETATVLMHVLPIHHTNVCPRRGQSSSPQPTTIQRKAELLPTEVRPVKCNDKSNFRDGHKDVNATLLYETATVLMYVLPRHHTNVCPRAEPVFEPSIYYNATEGRSTTNRG